MSHRICTAARTAKKNTIPMWMLVSGIALLGMLVWTPVTALAETTNNGWVLDSASVVGLPENLVGDVNLEDRTLHAKWRAEHSRGLSSYTWEYDVQLNWSAPPAMLTAGDKATLSWTLENSSANPLLPQEALAWAFYAPELRWAGLGDADTLPCDHSPVYLAFGEAGVGRNCEAITRAPESDADRMAIILETGVMQNGEFQNVMIQYTYAPARMDGVYVESITETTPVSNSTDRFIKSPVEPLYAAHDCGIGFKATMV